MRSERILYFSQDEEENGEEKVTIEVESDMPKMVLSFNNRLHDSNELDRYDYFKDNAGARNTYRHYYV